MRIFNLSVLVLTLLLASFQATNAQGRIYSNEFLSLGVGARALGMGNTQVAAVSDVTSGYWNPAGLTQIENFQVSFMHSEWFSGQGKYDYLGLAAPIIDDRHAFGLTILRFGVDDIPNTLYIVEPDGSINYDNLSTFSAADYAFVFSYAQYLKQFQVGGNVKLIHRQVGSFANAWGFGIDLSAQYSPAQSVWRFGANLRNVTTTINAWSFNFSDRERDVLAATNNEIPINSVEITRPELLLGAARLFTINTDLTGLVEMDWLITTDGKRNTFISSNPFSIDPRIGAELGYKGLVYLRTGFNNIQRITADDANGNTSLSIQPNIGVGINVKAVTIDYAFTGLNNTDTGFFSHVFSIRLNWKAVKGETI